MNTILLSKDIFLIKDFWSMDKCDEFIAKSESRGYEAATIQTDIGPRVVDNVRNNNRVLYKDFDLAKKLWEELELHAPKSIGESDAVGFK